ncbi:MAG: hypothetical protein KDK50_03775 [Chlamydiia bacterium]|nr:hypothetical protein [Chlamydiia bacterium]
MTLKILDTGKAYPQVNMDLDKELLNNLDDTPILHTYDWEGPAATHGHFIKPEQFLNLEKASDHGLRLGRRPTGGGIIFHVSDYAFSLLVPASHPLYSENTLENYQMVNGCVKRAVQAFLDQTPNLLPIDPVPLDESTAHFCMAKPTIYDVMLGPYKIAGAAQRRTKRGFLHQGSISLTMPPSQLLQDVLLHESVKSAMGQNTLSLLGDKTIFEARSQIADLVKTEFAQKFD